MAELATLAGTIATDRSGPGWQTVAVGQALKLWKAAVDALHPEQARAERIAIAEQAIADGKVVMAPARYASPAPSEIPTPESWPTDWDTFARLVIGGRTEAERLLTFREFWRDSGGGEPDEALVRLKQNPLGRENYMGLAADFLLWRDARRRRQRSEAGSKRVKKVLARSAARQK